MAFCFKQDIFFIVFLVCHLMCIKAYVTYNSTSNMCCDGAVVSKGADRVCCGRTSVSTLENLCCNGRAVALPTKGQSQTYGCCYNADKSKVVPYKYETQTCCDGVAVLKQNKDIDYKCFRGTPYDPNAMQVLGNNLIKHEPGVGVCENVTFKVDTETCCRETVLRNGQYVVTSYKVHALKNDYQCCGAEYYSVLNQVCCSNSKLVPKPSYVKNQRFAYCCGSNNHVVDPATETCCRSTLYKLTSNNNECCGDLLINSTSETCCAHKVFRNDSGKKCCFSADTAYDPATEICCNSEIVKKTQVANSNLSCCAPDSKVAFVDTMDQQYVRI